MKIHKIRAAVIREPGSLQIEALEMEGPREDEVLVRLKATGICHTDIDFCDDWRGPPAVLGHEGAGTVAEAGKKITYVKQWPNAVRSL